MTAPTLTLVPTVTPDRDWLARKHADDLAELELCAAFAKYVERKSCQSAIEALGNELERFADEAGKWNGESWLMRSRAMFEISEEA